MLIAGQTVLSGRLSPWGFLVYWLICGVLTGAAMVVAIRDLRAIRRRNIEEQRRLFHTTLEQIAQDARVRASRQSEAGRGKPPPAGATD
jgi:hypothetical protein